MLREPPSAENREHVFRSVADTLKEMGDPSLIAVIKAHESFYQFHFGVTICFPQFEAKMREKGCTIVQTRHVSNTYACIIIKTE